MNDPTIYRLIGEIVERLQERGCPSDAAARAERAMVSIVVNTMRPVVRAEEAAQLLCFGATSAALAIGVHRATVYRRAKRRKEVDGNATVG